MTRHVDVVVESADIARFRADVIALKYARGLFGASLAVARALGKTEADMQRLLPAVGSTCLLPGLGAIGGTHALFLRVVQLSSMDDIEIRQFGIDVLKALRELAPGTRHLAMPLHGTAFGLDPATAIQSEIGGCAEAVRAGAYPPQLERISVVDRDSSLVPLCRAAVAEVLPEGRIALAPGPASDASEPPAPPLRTAFDTSDVFLSFKSEDAPFAEEVYAFLTTHGVKVFFSRASLPRLGSDEYHEQIDAAVERARHMVVVTTSGEHAAAKWVAYEWRLFLGEKLAGRKTGNLVTVVPPSLGIGELPISLRNREVLVFTPANLDRLLAYLRVEAD